MEKFQTHLDFTFSAKTFWVTNKLSSKGKRNTVLFYSIGKKFASQKDIVDSSNLLRKWKLLVPKAPIAGQTDFTKPVGFYYDGNTRIAEPGSCCTESFIVAVVLILKKKFYHLNHIFLLRQ